MNTFYGIHNGKKVFFTVLNTGGCIFTARRKAMDVCDAQGWDMGKAVWM